jgi:hypothetical protein
MWYSLLANIVVVLHFGFVLFVLFGGLLILKWPRMIWPHLLAVVWGALVEFTGWICPLTPLENWLRAQEGIEGYPGDFFSHYLHALLYPEDLTRSIQILLGMLVIAINLAVYGWILQIRRFRNIRRDSS